MKIPEHEIRDSIDEYMASMQQHTWQQQCRKGDKLTDAIVYLRLRGKYIADIGCMFKPTHSTHTDIRQTFAQFR